MAGEMDYRFAPTGPVTSVVKEADVNPGDVIPEWMTNPDFIRLLRRDVSSPAGQYRLYEEVKTAAEEVNQDVAGLTERLKYAVDGLCKLARQAVLEGNHPADIVRVMYHDVASMNEAEKQAAWRVVTSAMAKLGQRVTMSQIPWSKQPTPGHELTKATHEAAKIAAQLWERTRMAEKLSSFLIGIQKRLHGREQSRRRRR